MAHFAEIDENNTVLRVLVVDDSQEHRGQEFLAVDCGLGGTWIQTSYNSKIRGTFAAVGGTYDAVNDRFIERKVNPSWVLNSEFKWEPPIPRPDDGGRYVWDEDTISWITLEQALLKQSE